MGVTETFENIFSSIMEFMSNYWYLVIGAIIVGYFLGKRLAEKRPIDLEEFAKKYEKFNKKTEKLNKPSKIKQIYHGKHFIGVTKTYSETQITEHEVKKALKSMGKQALSDLDAQERAKLSKDFKPFTEIKITLAQRTIFNKYPIPIISNDVILRAVKTDLSFLGNKIIIPEVYNIKEFIGKEYVVVSPDNADGLVSRVNDDMMTLLVNWGFTVHSKNMEKLAGTEPNFAQIRELLDRQTKAEIEKKRLRGERY